MTTISTFKKLTVSTVITGFLGLGLGGAVVAVAAPANAAPDASTLATSSTAKWSQGGGNESIRMGDAARASRLSHPHHR
jgi:hypothetical protein